MGLTPDEVMGSLLLYKLPSVHGGPVMDTISNHATIVALDAALCDTFRYDPVNKVIMVLNGGGKAVLSGPFPRRIRKEDYVHVCMYMQSVYGMAANLRDTRHAVATVSKMPSKVLPEVEMEDWKAKLKPVLDSVDVITLQECADIVGLPNACGARWRLFRVLKEMGWQKGQLQAYNPVTQKQYRVWTKVK